MKSKSIFFIALAVLIVSVSCMSTTQVSNNDGPTQEPQLSSPFAADASSPMSVQLNWKPVTEPRSISLRCAWEIPSSYLSQNYRRTRLPLRIFLCLTAAN